MNNRVIGVKKSRFSAVQEVPEGSTFDFVSNGQNHKIKDADLYDQIGNVVAPPRLAFNSVQDMKDDAKKLKVGDIVQTYGYYEPGDGGGNHYEIVDTSGIDDGGSFIDLPDIGRQAKGLFLDSIIIVKQFGALGDGLNNDSSNIQNALNFLATGGILLFPKGEYRGEDIDIPDNILMKGESLGSVTLKIIDDSSGQFLKNEDAAVPITIKNLGLENIIFDGNKINSDMSSPAASVVAINGVEGFYAKNCIFKNATGYGLALQARPGQPISGEQNDIYLENCQFNSNGDGTNFSPDTFDGLDIKDCERCIIIGCSASNNSDKGIDVRGKDVSIQGGSCRNNGSVGYGLSGNSGGEDVPSQISVSDCHAHGNLADGFQITAGSVTPIREVRCVLSGVYSHSNSLRGISITSNSDKVQIQINGANLYSNGQHGFQILGNPDFAIITNSIISGNIGSGIVTDINQLQVGSCRICSNGDFGINEATNGQNTIIANSIVQNNASGSINVNSSSRLMQSSNSFDYEIGVGDIIPSSANLPITSLGGHYFITGTTTIDDVDNERRGREVTLQFTDSVTVTHGSGIFLSGGANLNAVSGDILTIISDGADWFQVSFSSNS